MTAKEVWECATAPKDSEKYLEFGYVLPVGIVVRLEPSEFAQHVSGKEAARFVDKQAGRRSYLCGESIEFVCRQNSCNDWKKAEVEDNDHLKERA